MSGQPQSLSLDEMVRRLSELEARVTDIESRLSGSGEPVQAEPVATADGMPDVADSMPSPAQVFPVLGRGLLAIAGAYLLRALTEVGTLALTTGVAAGIGYAIVWLALAARTPAGKRLEVTVRSATAALIAAPLIWESTVRFHELSNPTAAALLALFTVLGLIVSWRKNVAVIAWITLLSGLLSAWALLLATRDVAPFMFALLAIAGAVEVSACLEHWLPERWAAAAGANLAVLLVTYLSTMDPRPEAYRALAAGAVPAAQAGLLAVYLTSTIVRTLARGFPFTAFETTQCGAVFAIVTGGAIAAKAESGGSPIALPVFLLVCGGACYAVSSFVLGQGKTIRRNSYTYSTFALLLVLAGTWMLLPPAALSSAWALLAVACVVAGSLRNRLTLRWHGTLYLALATLSSGIAGQAGVLLLGTATGLETVSPAGWLAGFSTLACFVVSVRYEHDPPRSRRYSAFFIAISAILVWHAAGLAAGAFTGWLGPLVSEEARLAYCATIRTGTIALTTLALAMGGARWRRPELAGLGFPLLLLGAYKLVAQDLGGNRTMALFFSLLLYGGTLMLLPRMIQRSKADS